MLQMDQCVQAASVALSAALLHLVAFRRRLSPQLAAVIRRAPDARGASLASTAWARLRDSSREERMALTGLCIVLAFVVL